MASNIVVNTSAMASAHEHATTWAEIGYTEKSRAYWAGMRDTLAVLLGYTTKQPIETGPDSDAAAFVMLPGCRPVR